MASPATCTQLLIDGGFKKIGVWKIDALTGSTFIEGSAPREAGIYAHVIDGKVAYVGSAQKGIHQRMRHYQKTATMRTAFRVRESITSKLREGAVAEVYVFVPPVSEFVWSGLPINLIGGIEEGLIRRLRPAWNIRGLGARV